MLNNSPAVEAVVSQPTNATSQPLIPLEWASTIAGFAALVAIGSALISGLALKHTRKTARQTSFDNHYGDDIRTGLRDLEDICGKLRAMAFPPPSTSTVNDLKKEVPGVQNDIEERCFKIGNRLNEVDGAKGISCNGWCKSFQSQTELAGLKLESATGANIITEQEFRARIESARDLYRELIAEARRMLEVVRTYA